MRNSSSASSETRLLIPPKALVDGNWPAPPWYNSPPPPALPRLALTPSTIK